MVELTDDELNRLKDATELNIFRANHCGIISDAERDKQLNDLKEEFKSFKSKLI